MKIKKRKILGIMFGCVSGITWAIDTVIVGMILSNISRFEKNEIIILPLTIAFLKDSFSCVLLNSYIIKKGRFVYIIKCILKGRVKILILGSILGGPIGMTLYILSIKCITPEGAANISAIYPIVTAVLSCLIIKEKLTIKNKIGIFLSFLGIFTVGYSKMQCNLGFMFYIGLFLILGTILCWSLESILYSLQIDKFGKLTSEEALAIREIVAVLTHFCIIICIIYNNININNIIVKIYPSIFVTSCISLMSYLLWYKSISFIGPTKATTLNVTYVLWIIVFQVILFNISIKINFILGSIIILMGSILMINSED